MGSMRLMTEFGISHSMLAGDVDRNQLRDQLLSSAVLDVTGIAAIVTSGSYDCGLKPETSPPSQSSRIVGRKAVDSSHSSQCDIFGLGLFSLNYAVSADAAAGEEQARFGQITARVGEDSTAPAATLAASLDASSTAGQGKNVVNLSPIQSGALAARTQKEHVQKCRGSTEQTTVTVPLPCSGHGKLSDTAAVRSRPLRNLGAFSGRARPKRMGTKRKRRAQTQTTTSLMNPWNGNNLMASGPPPVELYKERERCFLRCSRQRSSLMALRRITLLVEENPQLVKAIERSTVCSIAQRKRALAPSHWNRDMAKEFGALLVAFDRAAGNLRSAQRMAAKIKIARQRRMSKLDRGGRPRDRPSRLVVRLNTSGQFLGPLPIAKETSAPEGGPPLLAASSSGVATVGHSSPVSETISQAAERDGQRDRAAVKARFVSCASTGDGIGVGAGVVVGEDEASEVTNAFREAGTIAGRWRAGGGGAAEEPAVSISLGPSVLWPPLLLQGDGAKFGQHCSPRNLASDISDSVPALTAPRSPYFSSTLPIDLPGTGVFSDGPKFGDTKYRPQTDSGLRLLDLGAEFEGSLPKLLPVLASPETVFAVPVLT